MLLAKYQCGSKAIGLKGNDKDILFVYDNKEEYKIAKRKPRVKDEDWHFALLERCDKIRLGCYAYSKMKLLEGNEVDKLKSFNFLEHFQEWLEMAKRYASNMRKEDKRWYHILAGIYFKENGKMTLTKEQKATLQQVKDDCINDELYKYIIDYLSKWFTIKVEIEWYLVKHKRVS